MHSIEWLYTVLVMRERAASVLLVEDSPDEEHLVMRAIRGASIPCQILVAHTTDEALEFLSASGPFARGSRSPDFIITDLKVGPSGGAAFITAVRSRPEMRSTPIVVFSGSASESQIEDVYRRGASSFLEKPMEFDQFASLVTGIVRYWGFLNTSGATHVKAASFPYSL